MDDDGAPWNEWSASDVASKLVDDDGGLRSARLARERGASRERLRKERAKLKDHIKRVAGRKACDVGRADYDAVIAAQDRLPGLDEELKSLARDERAAAAAALRADHAAAEALRRAGVARRLGGDERNVARQGVAARRSLACRLDGIKGDAAVELANVAGKPRPSESTEMVAVRALLESNLKAKRFREARRYLGILESMEEDARRREAKRLEDAANSVRDRAARDATGAERASAARMETRYAELRVRRRGALGDERRARRTRALRVEYRASVAAREGPAPLPPSPVKRRAALAPFRGAAPGGRGDTRVCGRHDFDTAADGTVSFDAWSKTFAPKRRLRAPACDDAPAAERPRSSDPLGASFWITTGHLSHGEDTAAGALSPRGPLYGQRLADLRF